MLYGNKARRGAGASREASVSAAAQGAKPIPTGAGEPVNRLLLASVQGRCPPELEIALKGQGYREHGHGVPFLRPRTPPPFLRPRFPFNEFLLNSWKVYESPPGVTELFVTALTFRALLLL